MLVASLTSLRPELIVLEATGSSHQPLLAALLLTELPARAHGNPTAAAYAGLHPRQEQSGQRDRSRLSKQGCPALRRSLYLATLDTVRCYPVVRTWYAARCARGKAPQSALCGVAHKVVRRMMGHLRQARAGHAICSVPLAP